MEAKTCRRRSKCMEASARLTPGLWRSSWSTASSTARLLSTGMENGSMRQGETQLASYFSSGASATSRLRGDGAGARDLEGQGGGRFDAVGRQIVGGGEAPAAEGQHANADALRFGAGDVAGLAVLGGDVAVARFRWRGRRRR